MIGDEGKWRKVTVAEARALQQDGTLIYWRPNMQCASPDNADNDPAYILEDCDKKK